MNITTRAVVFGLLAFFLFAASPLAGQQPLPLGTGAGGGLGAMTEARLSEAASWNPALAAIFDGPMTSISLLGVHIEPGSAKLAYDLTRMGWRLIGSPVSVIGDRERTLLRDWRSGDGMSRLRAGATVHWIGLHSRDLLISLASYAILDLNAPDPVLSAMIGESATAIDATAIKESRRSIVSVLSVAKGSDLGLLPYLGRTWVGATFKAGYVHDHAIGRFGYIDPSLVAFDDNGEPLDPAVSFRDDETAGFYSEVGVQGARIYGVDVGAVINPAPPILVSVTLANALQKASFDVAAEDLYGRTIAVAGEDEQGRGRAFTDRFLLDTTAEEKPWLSDAETLARSTHFTPLLRVGASIDTRSGRLIGGLSVPLEREHSLDRTSLDEYSFGWQSTSHRLQPRLVYTRQLDGSSGVLASIQRGFCSARLALGAGYMRRPHQGHTVNLTVSWSHGSGPCGRFR